MKAIIGILIEYIFIMTFLFTGNFLLFIPIYFCMSFVIDGISGNFIKNSCFMITRENEIKFKYRKIKVDLIQGNICRLFKTLKLCFKKDKSKNFINEVYNLFKQLPQTRNNEIITYACTSHAYTYNLLKKLKENGYINILDYEKVNTHRLITEELAMGKIPTLKKKQMSNIIFTLTDKKLNDEDFNRLIDNKENSKNIQIENVVSKNNKKQELENMKKTLLFFKEKDIENQETYQEKVKQLKKICKF